MSGIKETLKEKYPWMIYIVLFVIVFALFLLFNRFNFFQTNPDSARYMLSALVQSEAAIVAIVITLSLVAVQLTASSYSPRVTEIFRKAPDLWILMISYIAAIIYGLGVLKLIEATPELNLEFWIRIAYFSGIFCFAALLPYTYNMFEMLKPSTIIKGLSKNITKENLLKGDPLQPIIDIVRASMMKYDYETTRNGLKAISERICETFQREKFSKEEQEKITYMIFDHFIRIGELAVNMEDEESAVRIADSIEEIGNIAMEKEFSEFVQYYTVIGKIGMASAKKGLERTSYFVAQELGKIGLLLAEKELEDVYSAIDDLIEIGIAAAEKDLEFSTDNVAGISVYFIEEVKEIISKNKKLRRLPPHVTQYLKKIKKIMKMTQRKKTLTLTPRNLYKPRLVFLLWTTT